MALRVGVSLLRIVPNRLRIELCESHYHVKQRLPASFICRLVGLWGTANPRICLNETIYERNDGKLRIRATSPILGGVVPS